MDKFRETIRRRMFLCTLYCGLNVILGPVVRAFAGDRPFNNFITGMSMGFAVICVFLISYYGSSLKNDELLRKLYIKETDERRRLIKDKTGSTAIPFIFAGLLLAMLIAGYFSMTVFFTLLGAVLFIAVVLLTFKLYYSKKI